MKLMKSRVLTLAAVLLVAGALGAWAAPVGKPASVTNDLAAYFASFGVDSKYLSEPVAQIPADQLALINSVITMADDTTNLVYYHEKLDSLIGSALQAASTADFSPVYLTIAGQTWQLETGRDPADTVPAGTLTVADPWVPLS